MATKAETLKAYKLTKSEVELISMIGLPDKIICVKFDILRGALSMRLTRIAIKLGVESRVAILVKALKLGIVAPKQLQYRDYEKPINLS